jgi:hypothetical protein
VHAQFGVEHRESVAAEAARPDRVVEAVCVRADAGGQRVVVARGGARLELLAGPRGDDPARQAQAATSTARSAGSDSEQVSDGGA